MELLLDPHAWIAFVTLTVLEIVLGIDNIIFISILVGRLPPEQRPMGRRAVPLARNNARMTRWCRSAAAPMGSRWIGREDAEASCHEP